MAPPLAIQPWRYLRKGMVEVKSVKRNSRKGGYAMTRKMSMLMSFFLLFLALGCAPEAKWRVTQPPPHPRVGRVAINDYTIGYEVG